jgi:hypothetical protein
MALKGKYNFKGIELSDAYLQISSFNYVVSSTFDTLIKTEAVMEADGITLKTPAVYESKWVKKTYSECLVKVFKDKATRDADPYLNLYDFIFKLALSIDAEAKNPIEQAYVALKADERYKEFTDV